MAIENKKGRCFRTGPVVVAGARYPRWLLPLYLR